jgi:hypothetical protein
MNGEINDFYSSSNIRVIKSRVMRWDCHVAYFANIENVYNIYVAEPEGKRPFERPRDR